MGKEEEVEEEGLEEAEEGRAGVVTGAAGAADQRAAAVGAGPASSSR